MDILTWMVFGLIVGVAANMIDPRPSSGGLPAAAVLGIMGAILGGLLGNMFFTTGVTGFNLSSFVIAVGGALLLLLLGRAWRRA